MMLMLTLPSDCIHFVFESEACSYRCTSSEGIHGIVPPQELSIYT